MRKQDQAERMREDRQILEQPQISYDTQIERCACIDIRLVLALWRQEPGDSTEDDDEDEADEE